MTVIELIDAINKLIKGGGTIKRLLLTLLIFSLFLQPAVAADVGAKKVVITEKYVFSEARCSCGVGDWYHHKAACFENYCPHCDQYGVLAYEKGPVGYTCPEGMWYCKHCDADYCCQCGKEHVRGTQFWLKPYKLNETEEIYNLKYVKGWL